MYTDFARQSKRKYHRHFHKCVWHLDNFFLLFIPNVLLSPLIVLPSIYIHFEKTTRKLEIYLWIIWNMCCARVLLWAQYSQISPSSISLPHFKRHGVSEMNFSTAIIIFSAASKLASGYFSYWKQHSFSKFFYNYS